MADCEKIRVTLFIVRHGECIGNKMQVGIDPFTDFLTDVGKEQAKLLGECFQDVQFTRVYASDYPRTIETAEVIMKHNNSSSKIQVTPEPKLRERDYTGLLGVEAPVIISRMMEIMRQGTPYLKIDMPNCETVQQFEDRLVTFLSRLLKDLRSSKEKEETLLFVSHGLTIQRLMVLLNSRPNDIGIKNWTRNLFSEKLMRNTNCHKLVFDIPNDENADICGFVERAHFREHVTNVHSINGVNGEPRDVEDTKNYTFLENEVMRTHEEETSHFCKPV